MPCGRSVLIQCTYEKKNIYSIHKKSALVKYRFVHEATHPTITHKKKWEEFLYKMNFNTKNALHTQNQTDWQQYSLIDMQARNNYNAKVIKQ